MDALPCGAAISACEKGGEWAEALGLLSLALNEAGTLRTRAAHMLSLLLEMRADIHDMLRHDNEAETDRQRAEQMRRLQVPEAAATAD